MWESPQARDEYRLSEVETERRRAMAPYCVVEEHSGFYDGRELLIPRVVRMILENGVVRTMDASLPAARALAIAGDRIAGGVGTHETALPTPERVDLGGRRVPRRSRTATCTSRPGCSPGTTSGPKTSRRWSRRSMQRTGGAPTAPGYGVPAGATPTGRHDPRPALDAVTGDRLAAWRSKGSLALAQLGGAGARRWRSRGGRRRRRAGRGGSADGRAARGGSLELPGAVRHGQRGGVGQSRRPGKVWSVANGRGVGAVHDKDGWPGAAGIYARIHEREGLTLRVWQSFPHEHVSKGPTSGCARAWATTTSGSAT